MFNPNAETHENLPESKPKCYWCEKTLRHFKGYFCSQRCGTLAGNALLSEMGIVWNESEQRALPAELTAQLIATPMISSCNK